MSNPYVGEIITFGGNFAPQGWAQCDGQLLSIAQNDILFTLIGTTYGGDGQTTFALPDLRGRGPIHQGQGPGLTSYSIGEAGGTESVTLSTAQLPSHAHRVEAATAFSSTSPTGAVPAPGETYGATPDATLMHASMVQATGGGQPHDNMPPFLALNWCISLVGIFPSQN